MISCDMITQPEGQNPWKFFYIDSLFTLVNFESVKQGNLLDYCTGLNIIPEWVVLNVSDVAYGMG